ncbi:MAG: sigma-54-dependent Fis family transcriptional regulator [Phycisphaeraceae bacterium]|nr:MAG: sigma-54-dependent Fis family transcriptional regulator [Phycisphaeraceae bacterium]
MSTILVVDDKEMLRDSVGSTLQRAGFTIMAASGGDAALDIVARKRPDAIVTDLKMPGMTGLELLERIREIDDDLPVVLMTAYGTVETAVRAMKLGAFTYITKPFAGDELVVSVKRAIEHARLKRDNAILKLAGSPTCLGGSSNGASNGTSNGAAAAAPRGLARVIGDSPAMRTLKEQMESIARSHGTVLVQGESGVGKEVVARAIHEMSPRSGETFLAMNCAALSESLLESELFGHEKGAFTGAERLRKGRFELADSGTLLLDEVSEVSSRIQAKLLRVLQERSFERVGSSTTIYVDVRVIATTNRDLPRTVRLGGFRQDLFFRLNVLPLHIPPLRERLSDVPALSSFFVRQVCAREGLEVREITPDAMDLLRAYDWPGNVRELQNICERAVVLSRGETIEASLIRNWLSETPAHRAIPAAAPAPADHDHHHAGANGDMRIEPASADSRDHHAGPTTDQNSVRRLEEIEREAIVETLVRFKGHRQRTAHALGIGVRTLGLKLKKWKEEKLVEETL